MSQIRRGGPCPLEPMQHSATHSRAVIGSEVATTNASFVVGF